MNEKNSSQAAKPEPPKISIHIDKKQFFAPKPDMTGAELKALGGVDASYDLFHELPGQRDDVKVGDNDVVHLKNGDHFYSVAKTLNPGSPYAIASV